MTDASGVCDVARYPGYIRDEARARFDAGVSAEAAAGDIDLSDFRDWGDPERIAVNVTALYRSSTPRSPKCPYRSCSCA